MVTEFSALFAILSLFMANKLCFELLEVVKVVKFLNFLMIGSLNQRFGLKKGRVLPLKWCHLYCSQDQWVELHRMHSLFLIFYATEAVEFSRLFRRFKLIILRMVIP